jgi:LacI family transcriptional regulator
MTAPAPLRDANDSGSVISALAERVTLAHVAREAGVSVPTVSKVLHQRPDVSERTRQAVTAVLERYDYRPTRRAATKPRGRAFLIELVVPGIDSSWSTRVLEGVEEAAHAAGYGVVVTAVHGRRRPPRSWLDAVSRRRSDGALLVLSGLSPAQRRLASELVLPFVLLDPVDAPGPDAAWVGATNWTGGLAATDHLLDLGHRRVAVISGPQGTHCSRARVDGYRAALLARNLPVDSHLIRFGEFTTPSGLAMTSALLDGPRPPTAIFCGSDALAVGAYRALAARGLRVPDDVSVVGFDDLPPADVLVPQLTTVHQPLFEMATMATEMVLRMIEGEAHGARAVEVATRLVVRESTAPPARPLQE